MTTPVPTDHRQAALDCLQAARVARQLSSAEYGKPHGERDYNLIGELRAAARSNLLEAQVHALLAPSVHVTVGNTYDAQGAARRLTLDAQDAAEPAVGDHQC